MKLLRALLIVLALVFGASAPAYSQGIGTPGYYIGYGKGYYDKKEYDLAAMYFHQALDRDPDNAEAHFLLGAALLGQGKAAEAQAQLDAAYALDPALKARAGELPKPRPAAAAKPAPNPVAKPAPATRTAAVAKPAAKPAAKAKPAASKATAKCDDLYASCMVGATRCNMAGCQTDFARQSTCTGERNQCYRRNGG